MVIGKPQSLYSPKKGPQTLDRKQVVPRGVVYLTIQWASFSDNTGGGGMETIQKIVTFIEVKLNRLMFTRAQTRPAPCLHTSKEVARIMFSLYLSLITRCHIFRVRQESPDCWAAVVLRKRTAPLTLSIHVARRTSKAWIEEWAEQPLNIRCKCYDEF
jgi:hypothetical protein